MKNLSFFNKINKIYFIGIGGISLSALALLMKDNKFIVSGSDRTKTEITKKIESNNIKVFYKQKVGNIKKFKPDLVVYTGAIKQNNPELLFAKKNQIISLDRAEFIEKILPYYNNIISIAGSHGKTTTTAMISEIFIKANLFPTVHIGGESVNLNSNYKFGNNDFFITEACEYNRSFLKFKSDVGVIVNIEEDHPDCYKNLDEIQEAFNQFSKICTKVIINENYDVSNKNVISFGYNNAQFVAKKIYKVKNGGYSFSVYKNGEFYAKFKINIFGKHNILNALASICVADFYNISKENITVALQEFKGIKRRFEKVDSNKIKGDIYFDYAHHPTEIKKLIEEVSALNRPIIVVFQPHTFTRTKQYFTNFLSCFDKTYQTIFYKTYSAREKIIKGARSKDLFLKLKPTQKVFYFKSFKQIISHLKKYSKNNSVVLFVGAGDIYDIKYML